MSPTVVILLLTAALTLVALLVILWAVVRRTTAVAADLSALQERIAPDLERLQRDADIAARELEQVSASLERLQQDRSARRGEAPGKPRVTPDDR